MRWVNLLLLFFSAFIVFADKQVFGYAAEPLMNEFGINSAQWGILGSSFFWLFIITSFVGGTWSDRLGTTKIIFIVLGGLTIVQLGAYAIIGLPMLMLYRILLGAFEGPFLPTGMSHITHRFPTELRGLALSIFISAASLGGIISSPILVAMMEKYGWRWTFVSLGVLSLTMLVIWGMMDRYSKDKQKPTSSKANQLKWSEIVPVLRNPACFLTLALSAATYCFILWMALWAPIYLTKVIKLEPMQMAYAISASGVASLVMVILISSISDHIFKKSQSYRKARVLVAAITTIIGGLALAVIPLLGNSILWICVALCVAKGSTYVNVSMSTQVMIKLMPERAGLMSSILTLGNNTTQLVAPIVIGILVQAGGANLELGFNYSIYSMVGLFILTSVLYLIFVKPDNVSNDVYTTNSSKGEVV
ncbi:MFS transporter [Peribacillus aracenensis]|uniref:MFS transporter n=1 Tax=Peribacillus aracenensis TaxID=2976708 RepID=UPI0021A37E23|nr:MFS transporter [Peribacillus sp. BBB004]